MQPAGEASPHAHATKSGKLQHARLPSGGTPLWRNPFSPSAGSSPRAPMSAATLTPRQRTGAGSVATPSSPPAWYAHAPTTPAPSAARYGLQSPPGAAALYVTTHGLARASPPQRSPAVPGLQSPPLLKSADGLLEPPPPGRVEPPFLRRLPHGGDHDLLCDAVRVALQALPDDVGDDLELAMDAVPACAPSTHTATSPPSAAAVPSAAAPSGPAPRRPRGSSPRLSARFLKQRSRPATATAASRSSRGVRVTATGRVVRANPTVVLNPAAPSPASAVARMRTRPASASGAGPSPITDPSTSFKWDDCVARGGSGSGHWKWVPDVLPVPSPMATDNNGPSPTAGSGAGASAPGGTAGVDLAASRASLAADVERALQRQLDPSDVPQAAHPWPPPSPRGFELPGGPMPLADVKAYAATNTQLFRRVLKHVADSSPTLARPLCRLWAASVHLLDNAVALALAPPAWAPSSFMASPTVGDARSPVARQLCVDSPARAATAHSGSDISPRSGVGAAAGVGTSGSGDDAATASVGLGDSHANGIVARPADDYSAALVDGALPEHDMTRAAMSEILITHLKKRVNELEERLAVSQAMARTTVRKLQTQLADHKAGPRTSWSSADIGPIFERVDNLQSLLDDIEDNSSSQAAALTSVANVVQELQAVTSAMLIPEKASVSVQTDAVTVLGAGEAAAGPASMTPSGPLLRSVGLLFGEYSHPAYLVNLFAKLKPSLRSDRVLRVPKMLALVLNIWKEKVLVDGRTSPTRPQPSFARFLFTYLLNLYGTKRMAQKHLYTLVYSLHKHRVKCDHPRLQLMLRFLGMSEPCACREPVPNGVCRCTAPRPLDEDTVSLVFRVAGKLLKLLNATSGNRKGRLEDGLAAVRTEGSPSVVRFAIDDGVTDVTGDTESAAGGAGRDSTANVPVLWLPLEPVTMTVRSAFTHTSHPDVNVDGVMSNLLRLAVPVSATPDAGDTLSLQDKRDVLMKQRVLTALTSTKCSSLRELFEYTDADKDGFISASELDDALSELKVAIAAPDKARLTHLVSRLPRLTSAELRSSFEIPHLKVELERVLLLLVTTVDETTNRITRRLLAQFNRADDDNSGVLGQARFIAYMQSVAPTASVGQLAAAFEHPHDFVKAVSSNPTLRQAVLSSTLARRSKPPSPSMLPSPSHSRGHHRSSSKGGSSRAAARRTASFKEKRSGK